MDDELIVSIFLVCMILLSVDIFRRIFTEIFRIQNQQENTKVMRRLRKPTQPWVTVLLYGDSSKLEMTMKALRKSRYHNYDYVVVGPRARTYQTAYRKSKRGKIVIALPMGVQVDPNFIKRTVAMKQDRRTWKVEVEQPVYEANSFVEIITRIQAILWRRPVKVEAFIAADLRKKVIQKRNSVLPLLSAVITQTIGIGLIIAGIIYADLTVLWYAWILVSSYILILIWFHYNVRLSERFSLSLAVPSALFLIPVASAVQGISQLSTRK